MRTGQINETRFAVKNERETSDIYARGDVAEELMAEEV